jgi:hypothetical protein
MKVLFQRFLEILLMLAIFFMNRNIIFKIKFHGGENFGQIVVIHGLNFKMV